MQYNLYNCDLRNNLRITNSVRGSFPEYENDNDNPPPHWQKFDFHTILKDFLCYESD